MSYSRPRAPVPVTVSTKYNSVRITNRLLVHSAPHSHCVAKRKTARQSLYFQEFVLKPRCALEDLAYILFAVPVTYFFPWLAVANRAHTSRHSVQENGQGHTPKLHQKNAGWTTGGALSRNAAAGAEMRGSERSTAAEWASARVPAKLRPEGSAAERDSSHLERLSVSAGATMSDSHCACRA